MYKTEKVGKEHLNVVNSLNYYSSLEKKLSKEYFRISELMNDRVGKQMLKIMGSNCRKNALLLQEIIEYYLGQNIIDSFKLEKDQWPNISDNSSSVRPNNEAHNMLKVFSAFEEYLKVEYSGLFEYFKEKESKRTVANKFLIIAERHEEYNLILKNLLKISDVDSILVGIFGK